MKIGRLEISLNWSMGDIEVLKGCCFWGSMMERVVVTSVVSVLLLGQSLFAGMSLIGADPFVGLSLDSRQISLPQSDRFGVYQGEVSFTANIVANCRHHVAVAFEGFESEKGVQIKPEDTSVAVGHRLVPVGGGVPVPVYSARETSRVGVTIPVELRFVVRNLDDYPAGKYSGALEVAVLADR